MENKVSTFSERLKQVLFEKDVSAAELSRAINVNQSTISGYIKGSFEPRANTIYQICKFLNISETWLMGYDVDKKRIPDEFRELHQPTERDELVAILQDLKENPEKRMLFSVLEGATKEDILKAVAIIEALKKTNI